MTTPLIKIVPDFSTTLASKMTIGDTTGSLSTNTDSNGNILSTGKYGFTIDRKNSSKEYFTATVTGTSLTNVSTIDIVTGLETSGISKTHRKGTEIIISDFVAIKRIQNVLETGYVDTYVPTTDYQIATKAYADGLTIGGSPNADQTTKGIAEVATMIEINSDNSTGATGASLIVTPDQLVLSKYGLGLTALSAFTGVILPFAGSTAPSGFLLCDGSAVNRTTYATLFAVTSTTYGIGNGTTTFNLPDLRGRIPVGKSTDTEFDTLGETGGEKTHVLNTTELASHTHGTWSTSLFKSGSTIQFPYSGSGGQSGLALTNQTESTGSGIAHNNLQPYIVLQYIIKY